MGSVRNTIGRIIFRFQLVYEYRGVKTVKYYEKFDCAYLFFSFSFQTALVYLSLDSAKRVLFFLINVTEFIDNLNNE